jgi:hypothetical protein
MDKNVFTRLSLLIFDKKSLLVTLKRLSLYFKSYTDISNFHFILQTKLFIDLLLEIV